MIKKSTLFVLVLLAGLAASAQPIPNYVPLTGLKAYYGFTNDAHDWTGTVANNGTMNTYVYSDSDRTNAPNTSYYFPGEPNPGQIDLPANSNLNFAGDFSLSFWMKTDSFSCVGYRSDIISSNDYGQVAGAIHGFEVSGYNSDGHISFITWDGGPSYHNTSVNGGLITTGIWTHIACVNQGTQHTIYKNGVMIATASGPAMAASQYHVHMGYNPYQCGHLDGNLDDVGIWNRALNQAEVTALYSGVPVGIADLPSNKHFEVYPNPASAIMTIRTSNELISSPYKVFDFTGREVLSGTIESTSTVVNIEKLVPGNYVIQAGEQMRQPVIIGSK